MSRELKQFDNTPDLARWYDAKYLEMGDGWNTPAAESNRHLDALGVPFDKSKTLLDVGFGAGHFLAEAEKRATCTGIEISSVGIEFARKRVHSKELIEMSIERDVFLESQFDYIVSIGSLEHIVDLPKALDNIRKLLKPDGKFYFYCPNERWQHFDQPNERTMTDKEWAELFRSHGLHPLTIQRWNDNTAFIGDKNLPIVGEFYRPACVQLPPGGNKLNAGSGQRPFDQGQGWINLDISPKENPDIVADWNDLSMFADESMDYVVSHHSLEHVGCNEGFPFLCHAHRILKPGGSLLIFVPDLRALTQRWMTGQLDTQIFLTNIYGPYDSSEASRHKWGYNWPTLEAFVKQAQWSKVKFFDWRTIPGADFARDWHVLALEAVK